MPSDTPPPPNTSPSLSHLSSSEQRPASVPPVTLLSKSGSNSNSSSSDKNQSNSQQESTSKGQVPQQFCLRWNNYQSNLTSVFDQLLQSESFVDVTLACDGHSIKAHKMVLSACSPYFQALFFDNPCQHPIIIMRDVKWPELKAIVEFMYKGEINVSQDQIGPLLKIAEMLKIRGLAEVNSDQELSQAGVAPPAAVIDENISNNNNNNNTNSNNNNNNNTNKKTRLSRERDPSKESNRDYNRELMSRDMSRELANEWQMAGLDTIQASTPKNRKRRWPSGERSSMGSPADSTPDNMEVPSPIPPTPTSISHPPSTPTPLPPFPLPPQLDSMALQSLSLNHPDDMEIKPGIAEMIREEERMQPSNSPNFNADIKPQWSSNAADMAKLLENSQAWLGASTSSIADFKLKLKSPTWTQSQLQEAIFAVVTQKMRFTQAAAHFNIPKGTLYDNILGKSHRMQILTEAGLNPEEENAVLEFCCDISTSPYNKRTKKSLTSILAFISKLQSYKKGEKKFLFNEKQGFRWWWAFCRKHSIVSLYYENEPRASKAARAKFAVPSSSKLKY